jgi:hypothetical protein
MKLSILFTTTIVLALSLLESAASSKLQRIRISDDEVSATTNTHSPPPSTSWRRRSLLIDEMPNVGLEDVDALLIDMSLSLSMSINDDIIFPEPEPGTGPVLPPTSPEFDLITLFAEALVSDFCCVISSVVSFLSNSQSHALCCCIPLFLP